MDKIPIALIAVIVVLAFVGGYFTGIMNSAGNFTLNVTNKTNDTGNYDSGASTYKYNTAKTTTKNTATTTDTTTPEPAPTPTPTPTPEPSPNGTG